MKENKVKAHAMKRICSLLLVVTLFATVFPVMVSAGTVNRTKAEAISWIREQEGKVIDTDGYPADQPYQCVDFIRAYYQYLIGNYNGISGNGKDYATNYLPDGFTRMQGVQPESGDILVYGASNSNPYGHVALYISDYEHYHQNFDSPPPNIKKVTYYYNGINNPYWGVIRPTFSDNAPINKGDDFYAYIIKINSWKHLEVTTDSTQADLAPNCLNVQLSENNRTDPKQVWHFVRCSDGGYKIYNCYNGKILDVIYGYNDNKANVQVAPDDHGGANQRWFIYRAGDGYNLVVGHCGKALDVDNNSDAGGTNVFIYERNGSGAQIFSIYKPEADGEKYAYVKPARPDASAVTSAVTSNGKTKLSWSASPLKADRYDTRKYELRVWAGTEATGDPQVTKTGLSDTNCSLELADGTYTAKVTAVNALYEDWSTAGAAYTFTVNHIETLKAANVTLYSATVTYNGKQRTPSVTVKNAAGETLVKGTDYTVSVPAGRTEIGEYIYVIKGIGNYTGTVSKVFTIKGEELKAANITLYSETVTYNGKQRTPSVTVKNAAGDTLVKGTDYTVSVPTGRTEVGQYIYVIKGIGAYTGTVSKVFTILAPPEALNAANVSLYSASVAYNGKVRTPSVTVKNAAGKKLTEGTDYTVTVPAGRKNVGTYTYKITGKGSYTGTVSKTFTINAQALKAENVSLYSATVTYNGKQRTPSVTVKNAAGDTLVKGTDYTVSVPAGRTEIGQYIYVIKGMGNYSGTVSKVFTITAPAEALKAANVTLYSATVTYNGKVRTPSVTVKNAAGKKLTEGTDYTVTVPAGRKNAGTYTYKITGKGSYSGTVSKVFTIEPQALKEENVTLYAETVTYNGKVRTPVVTVKNAAGETLIENEDYVVIVPDGRKEKGTYTYLIGGMDNYSGTIRKIFTIK